MNLIERGNTHLAKHHHIISPVVLSVAMAVVLGLITPTMLLAFTETSTVIAPPRTERRVEKSVDRPLPLTVSPVLKIDDRAELQKMIPRGLILFTSSTFNTSSMEKAQVKKAMELERLEQMRRIKAAMDQMQQAIKTLRLQYASLQKQKNLLSPEAANANIQKINAIITAIKGVGTPLPPPPADTTTSPNPVPPATSTSTPSNSGSTTTSSTI